ncbi:MAG: DNA repair protein RadC, partial [Desulfuromonadales bacterium]|nr:DNA repair protein RadC [Desulfuromonadales bacterium]
ANASCEAVLLLASPDALDSKECQRELNLAEDLGKEVMVAILRDLKKERFIAILLDNKNRLIRDVQISEGSLTASIVHPREVFVPVVRESAAAVLFVHNHPSGDPEPSREDLDITTRLRQAGELMGVRVLDHIIIGSNRYVSLADRGLLG